MELIFSIEIKFLKFQKLTKCQTTNLIFNFTKHFSEKINFLQLVESFKKTMSVLKEDVYESEDVPLTETVDYEEQFEDPSIEKIHVDMEAVIKLFGNRILNADDIGMCLFY